MSAHDKKDYSSETSSEKKPCCSNCANKKPCSSGCIEKRVTKVCCEPDPDVCRKSNLCDEFVDCKFKKSLRFSIFSLY